MIFFGSFLIVTFYLSLAVPHKYFIRKAAEYFENDYYLDESLYGYKKILLTKIITLLLIILLIEIGKLFFTIGYEIGYVYWVVAIFTYGFMLKTDEKSESTYKLLEKYMLSSMIVWFEILLIFGVTVVILIVLLYSPFYEVCIEMFEKIGEFYLR